jgi:hypothetical protein
MDEGELADGALRKRLAGLVAPTPAIFLDVKTEAEPLELPSGEAAEMHTDFQSGFIKAEAVGYEDMIATGSVTAR